MKRTIVLAIAVFATAGTIVSAAQPVVMASVSTAVAISAKGTTSKGARFDIPCSIYVNGTDQRVSPFAPSGWMGSNGSIEFDDCWAENPHTAGSCIKITFNNPKRWGGIAWQNPQNNWGDEQGGVDLTGATQLTFWARGETGAETVEFRMGIIPKDKPCYDTGKATLGKVKLTKEWKEYVMPLKGKNLSRIVTGFVFNLKGRKEPVTFYLDDIVYE